MKVSVPKGISPKAVVSKMFFLAYEACGGPQGMGFLQAKSDVSETDVFNNVLRRGDYLGHPNQNTDVSDEKGEAYGDYVFGRMMKLSVRWANGEVELSNSMPTRDYQSWCGIYPTYEKLAEAAITLVTEHSQLAS